MAFDNLRHAIDFLKTKQHWVIPERIGSIGWCFGGGWSYEIAKNNLGTKVSVIYYGRFNPKDDLSLMRARILGNFGENDRAIRVDSVREFQVKLKTLNGDHEIYIYPNAGHGFANPGGSNYKKEAADLAWKRTLTFLKKYL
jgi:carboxymethylenebutenolidase